MRVLFLSLILPNMDDSDNLYTELIRQFHENGHEIIAVAPRWKEESVGYKKEGGIPILRMATLKQLNVSKYYKAIANLLLPYQFRKGLKRSGVDLNFDLVITHTPPITLHPLMRWFKKRYGAMTYLILRDIFPQNAIDLNMMKEGSRPHQFFRKQEKKLYSICDGIGCMSQGNIDFVKKHNPELPADKLHMLPNWRSPLPYPAHTDLDEIRREYGFGDKFVVLFGGNIGEPQKMENIVSLAASLREHEDILFAIFGYGTKKAQLERQISEAGLSNIQLRSGIPHGEYYRVLHTADVGLLALSEEFTIPNIPSKALVYYNTKKPILAAIDKNTDMGRILEEKGAGVWAEANQTERLKELLLGLYNDPDRRREIGENGYRYLLEELTPEIAYQTIINHFE